MKTLKLSLVLILIILCQDSMASAVSSSPEATLKPGKVMQLVHKNGKKKITLIVGEKVKIWGEDDIGRVGVISVIGLHDIQIVNRKGETLTYVYDNIKRFRLFGDDKLFRIVGTGLVILGTGGMILGAISLTAGALAFASGNLGAIVLVAVPFLGGLGYGAYALGYKLAGKRIKLKKKWSFQPLVVGS